jgi:hypothetical protein
MQKLVSMIMGFMLALGLTSATYDLYHTLRKETLIKASKGSTKLSGFTQKMTGVKNAW